MSRLDGMLGQLVSQMNRLERELEEVTRRQRNMFRPAEVKSVDPQNYRVRLDAAGMQTKPIPWVEQAGSNMSWFPPSPGQKGFLISPSGEPGIGFFLPTTYVKEGTTPPYADGDMFGWKRGETEIQVHDKEALIRVAGASITVTDEGILLEIGDSRIRLRDGEIQVNGTAIPITGSSLTHNGKNVGDTHIHGGVISGAANTDVPAN